jgi:SP family sugar:H+ symporter-like MFS transporter
MTVALAVMAGTFATATLGADGMLRMDEATGRYALVAAVGYAFLFNMSWGPVMWVMLGEMFPNQLRGSGLAVSGLAQWLANFAITMTFPIMLAGIGLAGAYAIYALFALLSIAFVLFMVHETRGLELEEMTG